MYSSKGVVSNADLIIRCPDKPLYNEYIRWINKVFDSVESEEKAEIQEIKSAWADNLNNSYLEQSFRAVSLDEALSLL